MKPNSGMFVLGLPSSDNELKRLNHYPKDTKGEIGDLLKRGFEILHNGRHQNITIHYLGANALFPRHYINSLCFEIMKIFIDNCEKTGGRRSLQQV